MFLFKDNKSKSLKDIRLFGLSLLIAVVLLFVYSKNSLIYPMNDFCDENNFLSITDAMFHGRVLYKDIFDHKGPFLYLVYALIHILGNSYFTVYLFECIACAMFAYLGTKLILLYDEKASNARIFMYMLCLTFCLCTSATFMFGGTVEELYLWMSLYGLYVTLRCLKRGEYYSKKEIVIIGLLCGAMFWTKYSLLGLYSGLVLYVIGWNIAQKQPRRMIKTIAFFCGGFAITCFPVIIYGLLTQSLADMVNVYFIDNIWGDHIVATDFGRYFVKVNILYKDVTAVLLLLLGFLYVISKEQRCVKILLVVTIVPTFLSTCCLKVIYLYYVMPMLVFIPFGLIAFGKIKIRNSIIVATAALVMVFLFMASITFGVYKPYIEDKFNPFWAREYVRLLLKSAVPFILCLCAFRGERWCNSIVNHAVQCVIILTACSLSGVLIRDPVLFADRPLPQQQFQNAIRKVKDASILVYGMIDFGFNRIGHTYPQVKYFCAMNLVPDDMISEQDGYIKNEIVDFIITTNDISDLVEGTSYQLIDISDGYVYLAHQYIFRLYKKQSKVVSDWNEL